MLRITTSHSVEGAKKYFDVSLKTSDYYTRDIGTWGGKGAEMLGLKGKVERKDFVALVNNRLLGANGERLTARMNKTPTGGRGGQEDRAAGSTSRDRRRAEA